MAPEMTVPGYDDAVAPRYGADWVGAVVPGALADRRPHWFPAPAREARTIVVLVLDGLGAQILHRFTEYLPVLAGMAGRRITATVPSTTVAALTSITTGAVPAVHGLIGYRFRLGGELLAALQWRMVAGSPAPDPSRTQTVPPFLGRRVAVVNRQEFRLTGFTHAHLRGARYYDWSEPADLGERVAEAVDAGFRLVYAYDDRVDKSAHADGLDSDAFASVLVAVDAGVSAVLDRLPDDTALVVTADHGQLPVDSQNLIDLSELVPYTSMMAGEARFRSLHAATGATADLLAAARQRYTDIAEVLTREQIAAGGLLGGRPAMRVISRIGDVVLRARGPYGFIDPAHQQEADIKSMHGGLSVDEMEVPLLAARGRRQPGGPTSPGRG